MTRWIWGAFLIAGDLTFHLIGLCCNHRWLDHTNSLSLGCNHCHRCNAREMFTIFARNNSESRTFGSMFICKSWHHHYPLHSIYNLGYQIVFYLTNHLQLMHDLTYLANLAPNMVERGIPEKDHEKCSSPPWVNRTAQTKVTTGKVLVLCGSCC